MLFRRAQCDDFEQIVALQNQHLLTAIDQSDLANGFLATAYTVEQLMTMNRDMCVVVCEQDQLIRGYLGSCNLQFFQQFPVVSAMLCRLDTLMYRGQPLDLSRLYVANPVCIDAAYRGQGVYIALCQKLFEYLPKQYDIAVTLIPVENKRSLAATTRLGFEVVDQFNVNGHQFHTMLISMQDFERQCGA